MKKEEKGDFSPREKKTSGEIRREKGETRDGHYRQQAGVEGKQRTRKNNRMGRTIKRESKIHQKECGVRFGGKKSGPPATFHQLHNGVCVRSSNGDGTRQTTSTKGGGVGKKETQGKEGKLKGKQMKKGC